MTTPTPDQLQQQLAALTSTVNVLVSQFIRPNAQQAQENQQSISQIIDLLDRHAQAMISLDESLEQIAQQQQANADQIAANAQQIAANAEAVTQFDTRLEETRQLVAKNASDIAQMGARHDQMIAALGVKIDRNAEQVAAIAEASRTQLAAIIGNGRRIDRLEQQAS